MSSQIESEASMTNQLPYQTEKIPVANGLAELQSFMDQYPGYIICPYIADKTQEGWDSSTSRTYMNQVLAGFLYVPVNIPKDDLSGLSDVFEAVKDNSRVAAINITQPHKSSPVIRKLFLGDENSQGNVDTLIRNKDGVLEPYDLNAPAFVDWYLDEVGGFTDKTVILVGVGGVGEPMARAIAKQAPDRLILVDPNDKSQLTEQLAASVGNVSYASSLGEISTQDLPDDLILINAAGKEGATDNSGVAELLSQRANGSGVFVDIRPHLDIEIVEQAKQLGWQAHAGNGMNARNDYILLSGIADYAGLTSPTFDEFQKLVAAAS